MVADEDDHDEAVDGEDTANIVHLNSTRSSCFNRFKLSKKFSAGCESNNKIVKMQSLGNGEVLLCLPYCTVI